MTEPTSSSAPQAGGDETPVAPERFLMDHGMWHDLMTGQHLYTEDQHRAELDGVTNDAWAALEAAGVKRDGWMSLPEAIGKLAARPTPAAAAEVPTLTEAQLLEVFAKVDARCEQDATMLRIDAEGGYVDTLELLGARHGWRAFLRAARAVEAALASPVAPAGVPTAVDWLGLALELESQAKRVESQTAERSMLAAAHGLRLMGAVLSAGAPAVPLQDSSSSHLADNGSSRALRAASQEAPLPEHTLLSCPRCDAVWAFWPKGYGDDPQPFMNVRSKTWCGWCERANASELVPAEYVSVPARADLGMVDAAIRCSNEWSRGLTDFASLYRAMLEAAPRRPIQCDGRDGVTDSAASSEAAKPLASNEQDGNARCEDCGDKLPKTVCYCRDGCAHVESAVPHQPTGERE